MTLRETVLQDLLNIFLAEGINHLTNEQLANRLDISNATLRDMFADKSELVSQVVQYDLQVQKADHAALLQKSPNAVEDVMHLLQYGITSTKRIKSDFITELIVGYPKAWGIYLDHLGTYSYHQIYDIINKGILEGNFRRDINIQLVVKIILEQVKMLLDPAVFSPEKYDLSEVFRSIFLYYIRGICTDTGSKISENFFARVNR
jgi:AcrR family transcriptional regulator